MKIKQYLPFTELSFLQKVLWTVVITLVITFIYFANIYASVIDQKTETFGQSKQQAIEHTPLNTVTTIKRFHGESHYDIVTGSDEDGKKLFVFVPTEDNKKRILFRYANAGITEEQILKAWKTDCNACQLVDISLGIDQDQPLWEITYVDQDNRYVFSYYKFSNGKNYEQFRVNQ